jgi:hypothetical protein
VLDQEHGLVTLQLYLIDEVEDHRHLVEAHARGRFVEHEDPRLQRQEDRDLELALVAVRQRRRRKCRSRRELDPIQPAHRLLAQPRVARGDAEKIEPDLGDGLHREAHVLENTEVGVEIRELERAAKTAAGALRRAEPGDVSAEQADAAVRRLQLPGDQIEVGRLAGAVGTDDRGERALTKSAGHCIDGDLPAEADGQIAGGQGGDIVVHSATLSTSPMTPLSDPRLRYWRTFLIGIFISSIEITRVSSGIAQATLGSTLILKAYIGCSS